jgi:hypothetical protein
MKNLNDLSTIKTLFDMKLKVTFLSLFLTILFSQCMQNRSKDSTQANTAKQSTQEQTYVLEKLWASDTLLRTPESVIYDIKRNLIYISNVNQNPWEKDHNGFISKMSTTGEILVLEWVTGMSGPKGMAIVDDMLFVADLDELVLIDIEKGTIKEKVLVDGAEGMNDITPDGEGGVFISDSPAGKIFQYSNGAASEFIANASGRPNGLLVTDGKLYTAFSQSSEFVHYDLRSFEKTALVSEIGAGDGVTPTNDKDIFLLSDWQGEIFVVNTNGKKQSILRTKDDGKNTADIWFIAETQTVLVPTFFDNRVVAYKLAKS